MKFTIDKSIILENIIDVVRAISSKNIIPILNGIKLELNKDGLYLTASDSELLIKTLITKDKIKHIDNEGIIIVQSDRIVDIIRNMPQDDINFEVLEGYKINISSGNSKYNLNCYDPSEYPNIKIEEHKNPIIINSSVIKKMVSQTVFAISTQELRPLLTGINIKITGDILECIATDSYRLAKKTIKLDKAVDEDINIVMPGKNILELDKIIDDENNLEIHIFNNKIIFKYNDLIFQSNLLAGAYPNTTNLIPNEFLIILNSNLSDFNSAIIRAALLTNSRDKNIIKMHLSKNNLTISSIAEQGSSSEQLEVESNYNEEFDISFSARYMLEALKTFKDEQILILLNGDTKPIVIKSTEDESLIQLILPIKTY
ncbi:MAG: DNA polymerase III subunit beta [Bacilli bacterium]|nr:DNA polymerase III subunit beta [Bacilli bacterium]